MEIKCPDVFSIIIKRPPGIDIDTSIEKIEKFPLGWHAPVSLKLIYPDSRIIPAEINVRPNHPLQLCFTVQNNPVRGYAEPLRDAVRKCRNTPDQ
jgi:hypothetical protein